MKEILCTKNQAELLDAIGAGNPNPYHQGPVVVMLQTWDGKIVKGAYYKGDKPPNVDVIEDIVSDSNILYPFIDKLVNEGKSFIVRTGESDDTCVLEWTIK